MLKLKNLRPKDFADYACQVSVRNVCNIEDRSVTFRLTNATSKFFVHFFPPLTTSKCLKCFCVQRHIHALTTPRFFPPQRFDFSALPLSFIPSSHLAFLSIVLSLSLTHTPSPTFTCAGSSISFHPLVFSLPLISLSLSPYVLLSFLSMDFFLCPLTFHSNLLSASLSPRPPPSAIYCLSVLFFDCWDLMSGPSAVIQLSHSLLSPIHSAPLCPSARHLPATWQLCNWGQRCCCWQPWCTDSPPGKAPCLCIFLKFFFYCVYFRFLFSFHVFLTLHSLDVCLLLFSNPSSVVFNSFQWCECINGTPLLWKLMKNACSLQAREPL